MCGRNSQRKIVAFFCLLTFVEQLESRPAIPDSPKKGKDSKKKKKKKKVDDEEQGKPKSDDESEDLDPQPTQKDTYDGISSISVSATSTASGTFNLQAVETPTIDLLKDDGDFMELPARKRYGK